MGRRRKDYPNRPPNLEISRHPESGTVYFRYLFPDGKRRNLGKAANEAFEMARLLNEQLGSAARVRIATARPSPFNPLVSDALEQFDTNWLSRRRYSRRSREELNYKVRTYKALWGDRTVRDLSLPDLTSFLEAGTPHTYAKHRLLLSWFWRYCIARGWVTENLADRTMPPACSNGGPKMRQRHTLQNVQAMIDMAEPWLSRAIRLALYTLQRRADLVALNREDFDGEALRVLQSKSRNYNNPVHIRILLGPEALAAARECAADPLPGPTLLRARPKRMTVQRRRSSMHHFAVSGNHLTKSFSALRDSMGLYANPEKPARPTFHELRALGIHLYREAGYSDEYIAALSGHSEKRMVDHYDADHVVPIRTVQADLALKK